MQNLETRVSAVTFGVALERDDRRSCSSGETNSPKATIARDPKGAAEIAVEMAIRSLGSDRTVIISVAR